MSDLNRDDLERVADKIMEGHRERERQEQELAAMQIDPVAALAAEGIRIPDDVEMPEVFEYQEPACWVCNSDLTIDSCPPDVALCNEHRAAVWNRHCEAVLRYVIPDDQQEARPENAHRNLTDWTPWTGSLYLFGPTGTGKSHDAAAMLKRAWVTWRKERGRPPSVAWIVVGEFMDAVLDTFGTNDKIDMKWKDVDILVLDDIGMGDDRPFAVRKLNAVVERRSQRRKTQVTIVTSNLDLDELQKHYNDDRVPSRLDGMCAQVSYVGFPDRRSGMSPKLK